jgi:hypothetical protein
MVNNQLFVTYGDQFTRDQGKPTAAEVGSAGKENGGRQWRFERSSQAVPAIGTRTKKPYESAVATLGPMIQKETNRTTAFGSKS